jgi:hypothetical protein
MAEVMARNLKDHQAMTATNGMLLRATLRRGNEAVGQALYG